MRVPRQWLLLQRGEGGFGPYGGAIAVEKGAPLIRDCLFQNNTAHWGGAIYALEASPEIIRCRLFGNEAKANYYGVFYDYWEGWGGGIRLHACEDSLISDCLFFDNYAASTGAGVEVYSGSSPNARVADIRGCTFTENRTGNAHGIPGSVVFFTNYSSDIELWVLHSIVYHNRTPITISQVHLTGKLEVEYCDVEGGFAGAGNFDEPPCFVSVVDDDYRLLPTSPCIDAGDPAYVPDDHRTDLAGGSRLLDGDLDGKLVMDVGAFEFSNISLALKGGPTPGSMMQLEVGGTEGLAYLLFAGVALLPHPQPLVKPYGFLIVEPYPGLPPLWPLRFIPDVLDFIIPPHIPPGTSLYLLPVCADLQSHAGNFGAPIKLEVE